MNDPFTLKQMAKESSEFVENQKDRQQKTFVISRDALLSINTTAKQENISRDRLVDISISRLRPIIARELKKHNKRKEIMADMKEHLLQGEKFLHRASKLLGNNDRTVEILEKQQQSARKDISAIDALIRQGTIMEKW